MTPTLILASALIGQVYCQPVMVCSPTAMTHIHIEPSIHHHIQNVPGGEQTRFYTWVQIPDECTTKVPVINGYLPSVTVYKSGSRISSLILDYSGNHVWKSNMHGKVIQYGLSNLNRLPSTHSSTESRLPRTFPSEQERRPRTYPDPEPLKEPAPLLNLSKPHNRPKLQKIPAPAPVPKVGDYEDNTPVERQLPQPKVEQSDVTLDVLKELNERLDIIEKRMNAIDDLSNTVQNLTIQVGDLENKVDSIENRHPEADFTPPVPKLDMRKNPSDITMPELEKTKSFPTYER